MCPTSQNHSNIETSQDDLLEFETGKNKRKLELKKHEILFPDPFSGLLIAFQTKFKFTYMFYCNLQLVFVMNETKERR
jgi:hypothetical protein